MSKELIEQLAKEHGYVNKWPSPNHCGSTYSVHFSSNQLEAFAKAYAQTQGQSIPDGWKLVPINATAEMVNAVEGMEYEFGGGPDTITGYVSDSMAEEIYMNMIAAAPIESGVNDGNT